MSAAQRFRWIVLEDNEGWRRLLRDSAPNDFSPPVFVQSVVGLKGALALRPPHLISLDQHVPLQDNPDMFDSDSEHGLRALMQIRASRPLVRTAMYTAYAKSDLAHRAGSIGADFYITKSDPNTPGPDNLSAASYMELLKVLLQGGAQPRTSTHDPGYLRWALERGRLFLPPFLASHCGNITNFLNLHDWQNAFQRITLLREHTIIFAWAHAAALCNALKIKRDPVPSSGFSGIMAVQNDLRELWNKLDDVGRLGVWKGYVSDPNGTVAWRGVGNALFRHSDFLRTQRNVSMHDNPDFSRPNYEAKEVQNGILAMIDALAFWADHPLMTNVTYHPHIKSHLRFSRLAGQPPWLVEHLDSGATLKSASENTSERIHVLHRDGTGEHLVDLHPFVTMKEGAQGGLLPCLLTPRQSGPGPRWVSLLDYTTQHHLPVDAADAKALNGQ